MNHRNGRGRGATGAIAAILAIMTIGVVAAAALARKRTREDKGGSDGGRATGFHDEAAPYQGASSDFRLPEDMRAVIPEPPSYAPA